MDMIKPHPLSRLFRPIFEAKKSRSAFGGVLSVASIIVAVGVYPMIYRSSVSALEPVAPAITLETTPSAGPTRALPAMRTISQVYWSSHPGVDITAPLGSDIYPVQAGKVIEVSISKFDYGRSVVVDHGNGVTSRYAHMGKIMVDEGQEVTEKTVLGEVGLTGHTTGPHLHLEIRNNGLALNPLIYLKSHLM